MCFYVSLDQFNPALLAFVVFGFFSTKPRDWLGTWEERLRNDLQYSVSSGT